MSEAKKEKAYAICISVLATIGLALKHIKAFIDRVRADERACKAFRAAGACLIVLLVICAYTLVIFRVASDKAVLRYKAELEAVREQQEAAAMAALAEDPYFVQLREEATLGAKALEGIKGFNYDEANKRTVLQCIANRVLNPAYPDTVEDVLTAPGAIDFYKDSNAVTEENYQLCYTFFDEFHRQERLACAYDLVFLELGERVVLRDTFVKDYGTNTWWYGK